MSTRPLTVAIVALGGQGGGVLTGWLVELARARGWLAQSTYVAGVAQRTGATVYCVEILPGEPPEGAEPVFALYPVPGDVELVVASELAEAGRAVQKGFVTPDLTTLVASSHRAYAIDEKIALGDGRADSAAIYDGISRAGSSLICFDMAQAADEAGSAISAVMLGAIAASGRLPFEQDEYEAVIRATGKAVEANLAGFTLGYERARQPAMPPESADTVVEPPIRGPNGRALAGRVAERIPAPAQDLAVHGALRALEYQGWDYAALYLERLDDVGKADREAGGEDRGFELTRATASQLALQMCYEDTVRVAELKTRPERLAGIGRDLAAAGDQPWYVVEYFHPRYEEFCDSLPAALGERVLNSRRLRRWTARFFARGLNLSTNKLAGYLALRTLAWFRWMRPKTLRYRTQQARIEHWLQRVGAAAATDYDYALAQVEAMALLSGYGETYERGLRRIEAAIAACEAAPASARAALMQSLIAAALADEDGETFQATLTRVAA